MRTDLSPDQIAFYQENGFLIYEDLLSSEELAHFREVVTGAIVNRDGQPLPEKQWDGRGTDHFAFRQVLNLWMDNEAVRPLVMGPDLGRMLCRLSGAEGMRVWHDQALFKQPYGNPTAWHKDNPYWSFHHEQAISIWIALDDATIQNGCLWFLPGSHRPANWKNCGITADMRAIFDACPELEGTVPVAAPLKAGSCSFHHGLCAHGSGVNMTPRWRRGMTCAYMPDGATFNGTPNVLPKRLLDTLQVGDVLDDERQNPLIWHRSWEAVGAAR